MTSNTVPSLLDAALEPLNAVQEQVQAALLLAQQTQLPRPFLHTIQGCVTMLERTWETLLETAVALDPDLAKNHP